jgi:hypothetical protein
MIDFLKEWVRELFGHKSPTSEAPEPPVDVLELPVKKKTSAARVHGPVVHSDGTARFWMSDDNITVTLLFRPALGLHMCLRKRGTMKPTDINNTEPDYCLDITTREGLPFMAMPDRDSCIHLAAYFMARDVESLDKLVAQGSGLLKVEAASVKIDVMSPASLAAGAGQAV